MSDDDGSGVVVKRLLHNNSRMDVGGIDRTVEKLSVSDDPVPGIQQQRCKVLVATIQEAACQG